MNKQESEKSVSNKVNVSAEELTKTNSDLTEAIFYLWECFLQDSVFFFFGISIPVNTLEGFCESLQVYYPEESFGK